MAADTFAKYKDFSSSGYSDVQQKVFDMQQPNWTNYEATRQFAGELSALSMGFCKEYKHAVSPKACMSALTIQDDAPVQYVVTVLCDMLRQDSSCFSIFDQAIKEGCAVSAPLMALLQKSNGTGADQVYVADKAAWLLSSIMAHMPRHFSQNELIDFVTKLRSGSCSDLGVLEALTNLLKTDVFRAAVWSQQSVPQTILNIDIKAANSQLLYKTMFAIWMVSFDSELSRSLNGKDIVQKVKEVLVQCRTEKVIRISLTVLKNFLQNKSQCKAICEDIVEAEVLEAVQQLEYEKWRDSELYDEIKELVQLIGSEVKEQSNFDRYLKELESGSLSWGFIHSSKFFGENVMKFETGEFKAVKLLAGLLNSKDATTLAVACHDIGEFVSLHPLGKKQVARLGVKERVMELMGSQDQDQREVRREALLCCQKIMLNKWQDVAGAEKK